MSSSRIGRSKTDEEQARRAGIIIDKYQNKEEPRRGDIMPAVHEPAVSNPNTTCLETGQLIDHRVLILQISKDLQPLLADIDRHGNCSSQRRKAQSEGEAHGIGVGRTRGSGKMGGIPERHAGEGYVAPRGRIWEEGNLGNTEHQSVHGEYPRGEDLQEARRA